MRDATPEATLPPADATERLRCLWLRGEHPDVDAFLARTGGLPTPEVAAVLRVDQRERWRLGEGVAAEAYLARHPAVAADAESALDLIFNEFLVRGQCGGRPAPEEFLRRFPEHADALRDQIEMHLALTADADPGREDPAAPPLPVVPGYEAVALVGRGGMGVIYRARQTALNRLVALKMISAGAHASPAERARFKTEAEAVARLQHPNVAQIYEVGSAQGVPYLTLEWMDRGNLAQALAGRPLPPRPAAELVELLARAVQAAHERGVIHRDLKPANVLFATPSESRAAVGVVGLLGVPKVSDFGLAKELGVGDGQTASTAVLGTPAYMAPEQAEGKAKHVGPACDVYSLGAILYECLTGRPPFEGLTLLETLDRVRGCEPVSPSRLQPSLPRDLVTVCLKALAKEPGRRYASAAALADDLRRFLDNRPVAARPVTRWERGWRWCRRNPGLATLSAVAAALLLALLVGGGVASLVVRERNRAVAAQGRAERAEREVQVRSRLARAAAYRRSGQPGQRFRCLDELREALRLGPTPGERIEIRDEAVAALVLPDVEVAHEWDGYPEGAVALVCDASLKRLARLDRDGTVTLQRLAGAAAEEVVRFPAAPSGSPPQLWLGPDGAFVVVRRAAPAGKAGELGVWRVDWVRKAVSPRPSLPDPGGRDPFTAADFRPDGRRLALLSPRTKSVAVFDLETGRRCWEVGLPGAAQALAFRPDGGALAVARGAEIVLLDGASGRPGRRLRPDTKGVTRVASLAWHPNGRRLAAACDDFRIHLWDIETGREAMAPWGGQFDWGIQIAYNHAGDRLLSYDWSRQNRLWDANTGRLLLTLPGILSPQFSADDTLLGPQHLDGRVRLWRLAAGRELREFRPRAAAGRQFLRAPVPHGEGRVLAAVSQDGPCFFDLESGAELALARVSAATTHYWRCFVPPGGWVMSAPGGAQFWPARRAPGAPDVLRVGPPKLLSEAGVVGASASPDGTVLALANGNAALLLNRDGAPRRFVLGPQRDVRVTAVSPDRRWVATCSWHADPVSSVQLWDARTGRLERRLPMHDRCYSAWFSADSRWLVTTCLGLESRLWEAGTWREVRRYAEAYPAFSPDGRVMALGDVAGQVRLLVPGTGRAVARLTGPGPVWYDPVCFTPDGGRLIAVARDSRAVYAWDLRALRDQLRGLGLDWELPEFPPAPPPAPPPAVVVDRGFLAHPNDYPSPGDAVALFTLALALQPVNPEAHLQRGLALGRLNRPREAVADYSAFLALTAPDDPRRAEVLFRRSNNYAKFKEDAAVRDLRAMAALDLGRLPWPEAAARRCNHVAWEFVAGPETGRRPDRALGLARAAVRLAPDSAAYRNTLGVVLYRLGRWREAADALGHNGEAPSPYVAADLYFLAMCTHRLGDAARAREFFGRAVRRHEENGGRLDERSRAELRAFRAEAEELLSRPPRRTLP